MRTQWRGGKFSVCRVSFSFSKGEEKWLKIRKGWRVGWWTIIETIGRIMRKMRKKETLFVEFVRIRGIDIRSSERERRREPSSSSSRHSPIWMSNV